MHACIHAYMRACVHACVQATLHIFDLVYGAAVGSQVLLCFLGVRVRVRPSANAVAPQQLGLHLGPHQGRRCRLERRIRFLAAVCLRNGYDPMSPSLYWAITTRGHNYIGR